MIGIICAREEEIRDFLDKITERQERSVGGFDFVQGLLTDKRVVLCKCGVGKVNAAACAQALILNWPVKLVINSGVAGAIREPLERGDICIATDLVQFDLDASGLNQSDVCGSKPKTASYRCAEWAVDALLQAARSVETTRITTCRMATGDQYMGDQAGRDRVVREFDACAVDTESAAIARICFLNGVDCAVVHAIADVFDDETRELGRQYLPVAARSAAKVVLKFLEN